MNRNEIEAFVTRWLSAVVRGNLEEFEHLVSAEVMDLNSGAATTRAAFQERARALQRAFDDLTGSVDELVIDGERIAWRWTLTGTHAAPFLGEAATGKRVRINGTNFQRLTGGLVTAHYTLVDAFGLLSRLREP